MFKCDIFISSLNQKEIRLKKLYTVKETAYMTGYAITTIRDYVRAGEIKGEKVGNNWRFTEEQIKEFLDKKKKGNKNV